MPARAQSPRLKPQLTRRQPVLQQGLPPPPPCCRAPGSCLGSAPPQPLLLHLPLAPQPLPNQQRRSARHARQQGSRPQEERRQRQLRPPHQHPAPQPPQPLLPPQPAPPPQSHRPMVELSQSLSQQESPQHSLSPTHSIRRGADSSRCSTECTLRGTRASAWTSCPAVGSQPTASVATGLWASAQSASTTQHPTRRYCHAPRQRALPTS